MIIGKDSDGFAVHGVNAAGESQSAREIAEAEQQLLEFSETIRVPMGPRVVAVDSDGFAVYGR